ncbi:MAG: hypothetical protein R2942_00885 [Ignavibacteria bacterium]
MKFDGSNFASGVYFYRILIDGNITVLLKGLFLVKVMYTSVQ